MPWPAGRATTSARRAATVRRWIACCVGTRRASGSCSSVTVTAPRPATRCASMSGRSSASTWGSSMRASRCEMQPRASCAAACKPSTSAARRGGRASPTYPSRTS
eukprot:scaffold26185_cov62-Phaeocystis_antarctica.AAC.2